MLSNLCGFLPVAAFANSTRVLDCVNIRRSYAGGSCFPAREDLAGTSQEPETSSWCLFYVGIRERNSMSYFEPGACLSLWPTEDCEWSTWDIWRSTDIVGHAIYFGLALMLSYTVFVLIRFLLRYQRASLELTDSNSESGASSLRNRRHFIVDLSQGLGILKAIASTSPFLGLAGTAYRTLRSLFFGDCVGVHNCFLTQFSAQIAFALISAAAGIVVAVPAALISKLLCNRVELLHSRLGNSDNRADRDERSFQRAQSLPLRKRFSGLPPFALLAASALALVVCLFLTFEPYVTPTGLDLALPSNDCGGRPDRFMLLRIANDGKLSMNMEPVRWIELSDRLAEIYREPAIRELYLHAEDDVPFQTVADAIDIVRNSPAPGPDSLGIKVILVTPGAARACALLPIRTTLIKAPPR